MDIEGRNTLPQPGPGQLRIHLEKWDWEGMPWTQYPAETGPLGQEGWGRVDDVGPGVVNYKRGDRVATLSQPFSSEYAIAESTQVIPIPPHLDHLPFPGDSIGRAMTIFQRSDIRTGQTVAVVGIGSLGAVLTRLAYNAGARVIAISRRQLSLELAEKMGATHLIRLEGHQSIIEQVRLLTQGGLCERVIELTGKQWPLDLCAELTRERGKLVIAGLHQEGPRQVDMQLWNRRGLDVINAHERDPEIYLQGMRAAIEAVARGELDPTPLYSEHFFWKSSWGNEVMH